MAYGLLQIICQDCGEDMLLVHPQEVKERIATGEYVKGFRMVRKTKMDGEEYESSEAGIFGVCKSCARLAATAPDLTDGGKAQSRRIQARLAHIRERRPDLTLEQAARAAVNDEFDPHNEPNLAFRAWLLERADRDTTRDTEIAATFSDGPHAGGVA